MNINQNSEIGSVIQDYIESRERSFLYGRKRMDAEKEYNKLLTLYNGTAKNYTLAQADTIYRAYRDMIDYGEEATVAQTRFLEMEEKLKAIGEILFEASITAEFPFLSLQGNNSTTKSITVTFKNGQVMVS